MVILTQMWQLFYTFGREGVGMSFLLFFVIIAEDG
jgi:hypothetical protein